MSDEKRADEFPADDLDRWVRDQCPPEPSSAYWDRCLKTMPQPGAASMAKPTFSPEPCATTFGQPPGERLAEHAKEFAAIVPVVPEHTLEMRRLKMKRRLQAMGVGGVLAVTVALLLVSSLWLTQAAAAQKATQAMARCAASSEPTTIHIVAKMRTQANGNFASIDPKDDLVRIEAWRQFRDQPRWRLEEPGRVIVMDGASTIGWIRPNIGMKIPRPTYDWGPVLSLTDVQDLITRELRNSLARGWDMNLTHESTAGKDELVVTVETKAGLPDNDYLKNKYLDGADARRVYRFDAKTQKLEGMEAYLHEPGGDVLVLSTEKIEYDKPLDPALFALKLPKKIVWTKELERLPDNEKYEKMTPVEAARAFFEACAAENWGEVQKFITMPITEDLKHYLGKVSVVHLGKPFHSKGYAGGRGWFVPYEIKLKSGTTEKWNLALRNDKAVHRYEVDGGI